MTSVVSRLSGRGQVSVKVVSDIIFVNISHTGAN